MVWGFFCNFRSNSWDQFLLLLSPDFQLRQVLTLPHELFPGGTEGRKHLRKEWPTSFCLDLVSADLEWGGPVGLCSWMRSQLPQPEQRQPLCSGESQSGSVRADEDTEHEHCKAQHSGRCCFCRQRFKKHSSSRILPGLCPLPKWSKVSLPVLPFLCKARMCWDSWKPNEAVEQWGEECRKGNTAYGIMCSCTKNLDLAIAAADSNMRGFVAVPRACEVSLLKAQSFLQSPFPLSELLGREAVSH